MSGAPAAITKALTGGASQVIAASRGRYKGITVRETAGGALVLNLYDNASAASGNIVHTVALAANATATLFLSDLGVQYENGLYLSRVSGGAYEGSVYLG